MNRLFYFCKYTIAPLPKNFADELAVYHDREVPGDYFASMDPEYQEQHLQADLNWLQRLGGGILGLENEMEKDFWNQDDFANNVVWGVGGGVLFFMDALYVAVLVEYQTIWFVCM